MACWSVSGVGSISPPPGSDSGYRSFGAPTIPDHRQAACGGGLRGYTVVPRRAGRRIPDCREDPAMAEGSQLIRGLEGVVAAETKLCDLDGANGRLAYGGYNIDDLARKATFEEVCHLLWYGELPKPAQLDKITTELTAAREIPRELIEGFALMPRDTDPMRVLQAAVAILGMGDPDATDSSHAANVRKS